MPSLGRWAARRTRHRSRGQSLVELALIIPVMLLLFASALDLGRVFYSQITIANAAKEGALEAARNPTSFDNTKPCNPDTNRVLCLVLNEAKGSLYTITASDVSLACSPSPCPSSPAMGDTVTVTVVGHFTLATPILAPFTGGQAMTLQSSAVAQLGVEPEPGSALASSAPTAEPSAPPSAEPSASPVCETPTSGGSVGTSPSGGTSAASHSGGTLFTFTAPTVDPQPGCEFTYTWSFGDGGGSSGTGDRVTHTYADKGTERGHRYTITLVISTTVPGSWTRTTSVVVNP